MHEEFKTFIEHLLCCYYGYYFFLLLLSLLLSLLLGLCVENKRQRYNYLTVANGKQWETYYMYLPLSRLKLLLSLHYFDIGVTSRPVDLGDEDRVVKRSNEVVASSNIEAAEREKRQCQSFSWLCGSGSQ